MSNNIYRTIAQSQWQDGGDKERICRELSQATAEAISRRAGPLQLSAWDIANEFIRLSGEPDTAPQDAEMTPRPTAERRKATQTERPPAGIESRFDRCGFAYTDRTRMMYAPRFTVTRRDADKGLTDIVLCASRGHPQPTKDDIDACVRAVTAMYPADKLFLDGEFGMVPLYDPPTQNALPPRAYDADGREIS